MRSASVSSPRAEDHARAIVGTHCAAARPMARAPAIAVKTRTRAREPVSPTREAATHSAAATPASSDMSAEPVRSCRLAAIPQAAARPALGRRAKRTAASRTHGIHAAPARWCHRLTSDINGPEVTHTPPPVTAATRPSPSVRHSR
ncbi:MAG: hypothetical protein DMF78_18350 [Acidobacteria bacterium]|nr:MAG: hypothetical protein DMF78_18350 [Acidobacteriota bacterium]